jgi:hypothetical protein
MSRQYATYLCDGGPHVLRTPYPECGNAGAHAQCPAGYGAWWGWVEEVSKTHRPAQCPECRYWVMLTPK